MREFTFDYTDTKFTLKLLGLSFLSFVVLLIGMVVTVSLIGLAGSLILAFAVPLLIFFLNKKKIRKHGMAIIHDTYSEFKLSDSSEKIIYADIRTYQVERYNGTRLTIRFKDGKDFKLHANSNFCNSNHFDRFCHELDGTLQQFRTTNNVELTRKKSIFEQAWMLPFLIVLTGGIVGTVIFIIIERGKVPSSFYTTIVVLIPMWVAFFNARKRKKEQG